MDRQCPCGAWEGQLHLSGCEFERCPFCEGRLIHDCECLYDFLGLRRAENPPQYGYLSEEVYNNGPSAEDLVAWDKILTARGRLPFVYAPQVCGQCGRLWPPLFVVQDTVWDYYTGPELCKELLCEDCFHELRRNVDKYQPRPAWLPSVEEIELYIRAWKSRDRDTLKRLDPAKFEPGYKRPSRPWRRKGN
jgi:hypothetical protein